MFFQVVYYSVNLAMFCLPYVRVGVRELLAYIVGNGNVAGN